MELEFTGIFRVKLIAKKIECLDPRGANTKLLLQCDVFY